MGDVSTRTPALYAASSQNHRNARYLDVLAHDPVLKLGGLVQHVDQCLAMLDDEGRLGLRPSLPVGSLIQGTFRAPVRTTANWRAELGPRGVRVKNAVCVTRRPSRRSTCGRGHRPLGWSAGSPFDLDQDGRPAAVGEPDASHRVLGGAACSSAQSSA